MSSISNNPSDQNLFQGSKFSLSFDRLPYIQFFCAGVTIPGMYAQNWNQPTPFRNIPVAGDKLEYDPVVISFLLDEQLYSWTSIKDWMTGYAFPENFEQYRNLSLQKNQIAVEKPQYSDGNLIIYSNKNNPLLKITFTDMFPVQLSSIELENADSASVIKKASATFKFANYEISRT